MPLPKISGHKTYPYTRKGPVMTENQPALGSKSALTASPPVAPVAAPSALDLAASTHAVMVKEIRSWSYWLLGLGALHLVASGFLDAPWGILLLAVGLVSFVFQEAAMFVIYGVTLAWAATSNVTGGQPVGFSLPCSSFTWLSRSFAGSSSIARRRLIMLLCAPRPTPLRRRLRSGPLTSFPGRVAWWAG